MDKWLKTGCFKRKQEVEEDPTISQDEIVEGIWSNASSDEPSTSSFVPVANKKIKIRKYCPEYLSYGFASTGDPSAPNSQCVICFKTFSNSSLAPAKLLRHLQTNHSEYKDKPVDFFQRKLVEMNKSKKNLSSLVGSSINEKACKASFQVSYRIAKAGKAHIIAETLIKPCLIDVVETMIGEKFSNSVKMLPLSNDTVHRRIYEISNEIENTVIQRIKGSGWYALQLDETTDVAGCAVLLVIVRYIHNNSAEEEMLLCKPLKTHTTGEEIFKMIDSYITEKELNWNQCINICTDGAKAMTGKYSGFVARVKNVVPEIESSHCIIHRQALAVKKIPPVLKNVLDEAVKIVNFIKSRPLNSRIFAVLCEEMGSQFTTLLLHTEVRWLSRGKVLVRLFTLRNEVMVFLNDSSFELSSRITDIKWLQCLAYLADVFSSLNELNLSLQGTSVTVISLYDKIQAKLNKIQFWESCINRGISECFPTLHDFVCESKTALSAEITSEIINHLQNLQVSIREYFPRREEDLDWVRNPFSVPVEKFHQTLTVKQIEQLIDVAADGNLKTTFNSATLLQFWAQLRSEYPELAHFAVKKLLPFATTYRCEVGFSKYALTKTDLRSKLNPEADMRIQLSNIEPDIDKLVSNKQAHPSH